MAEQTQVVIVPMTHWDREHSRPFEQFRWQLVANVMPQLLELLRSQPGYVFTMDGQALAIEDYLDICPEAEPEIRKYVQEDRLLVGPFFVGPDEFIPSGESLIRNFLYGHTIARRFGRAMRVCSNPDAFGHIAQMPQILRGFGHDAIVFMRGGGNEVPPHGAEFRWIGADGSEVLVAHHPYGNAWDLPTDLDAAAARLHKQVSERPKKPQPCFLMTNGADCTAPQAHLMEVIAHTNARYPDLHVTCGTFEQFFDLVRPYRRSLPSYRGELRWGKYQLILGGVYSSRTYLKQANAKTQMLLATLAEPLASWAWLVEGEPYIHGFFDRAWRLLLQNHFHDTICACSQDKVYQDAMRRYAHSQQISEKLNERSTKVVARNVNTDLGQAADALTFVVYNPLGHARSEVVNARLYLPFDDQAPAPSYRVCDADGGAIAAQVRNVSAHEFFEPYMWERHIGRGRNILQFDLAIAADVPGCGYRTYVATPGAAESVPTDLRVSERCLENSVVTLEVAPNGTLSLTDKRDGTRLEGLNLFEDIDSACGEYNHYPSPNPRVITSARAKASVAVVESGPLCATLKIDLTLRLPEGLTEDLQGRSKKLIACPVTTYVTLSAGSPRVDFHTIVENNVKDHRLRVLFPTGVKTAEVHAEAPFAVATRPIRLPKSNGWMEPPAPESPQQTFVDVTDGTRGVAMINQGLAEYTPIRKRGEVTLALTLLRGVAWIGRRGFITAAYLLPTPEAQCLGRQESHYALLPHQGNWQAAQVWQQAHAFNAPLQAIETGAHKGTLPTTLSFLSIAPANLVVSAIKPARPESAEGGDALIVRLYNITGDEVEARVSCFRPVKRAQLTNLLEEPQSELAVADGLVSFPVGGHQIVTLKLVV